MQLMLNDEVLEVDNKLTISQFIEWLKTNNKLEHANFALAVNMEFVPRSIYSETYLKENDRVEIVLPMQGG